MFVVEGVAVVEGYEDNQARFKKYPRYPQVTNGKFISMRSNGYYQPAHGNCGFHQRVHLESPGPDRWKNRSRTLQGVADAMADQWSTLYDIYQKSVEKIAQYSPTAQKCDEQLVHASATFVGSPSTSTQSTLTLAGSSTW